MNRRLTLATTLFALLVVAELAHAHEGHPHKVMGTVATRHEYHLEVKATDGKTSMLTLSDKTKILRGKTKVTVEDIKPGERVVVTATQSKDKEGEVTMVATEVRLATATTATSK